MKKIFSNSFFTLFFGIVIGLSLWVCVNAAKPDKFSNVTFSTAMSGVVVFFNNENGMIYYYQDQKFLFQEQLVDLGKPLKVIKKAEEE